VERDHQLEAVLLEAAGGTANYPRQVLARLDQFEHDNGGNVDGWNSHVDRILVEAQEEAADITGWLVGAVMQLQPEQRQKAIAAMRHAAAAHAVLEDLRLDLTQMSP
jgi:hypothetical protein